MKIRARWRRLGFAAVAIGLPGVLAIAGSSTAMRLAIARAWSGASIGQLEIAAVDGRVALRDITLPLGDGATMRIGQLRLPSGFSLVTPALAAENVTLRDVMINIGGTSYRMREVEIAGSALAQQDLAVLLNANNTEPLAGRLSTLTAERATIPEIVIEYARTGGKQTITGRDLVLRDIAQGQVGSAGMAGGTVKGPAASDEGAFGAVNVTDADLALATRLFTDMPIADGNEPRRVVGALAWNAFSFKTATGGSLQADRISLTDFRAKAGALKDWPKTNGPLLGGVAIAGAVVDIPGSKATNERWKWQFKEFLLAADQPHNGIPTHLQAAAKELSFALAAGSEHGKALRDLGYDRLDISIAVEGNWAEAANEFVVKNAALDVAGLGSITLRGQLGNVTRDAFAADASTAAAARAHATAKSFDLLIEDKGWFERAVAREAKKDGKSTDAVREAFARRAARSFSAVFGNSPGGRLLNVALTEFAKKPGTLEVSGKAKSAAGVALGDFNAAAGNSGEILEKLDLKATAR